MWQNIGTILCVWVEYWYLILHVALYMQRQDIVEDAKPVIQSADKILTAHSVPVLGALAR